MSHQILSRNIGQYIGHLAAGCSYQHTVQNSKEYFEKWIKYLKLKKNKMADIVQDCTKSFASHMFGCHLYVHNTKKACSVRLRGCPHSPIHLDASMFECPLNVGIPPYVWMHPVCFVAPICLDGPLYVWMHPICLPVCLDTPMFGCPCMLGHPHMFG